MGRQRRVMVCTGFKEIFVPRVLDASEFNENGKGGAKLSLVEELQRFIIACRPVSITLSPLEYSQLLHYLQQTLRFTDSGIPPINPDMFWFSGCEIKKEKPPEPISVSVSSGGKQEKPRNRELRKNLRKDGGARLEDGRGYMDVDTAKQGASIGAMNPLAYILTGGDEKLATSFAGYFTNTVTQGDG